MKLPKLKGVKNWNYPAIAFGIPVVSVLFLMVVAGYEPFGNRAMLYSDMYHQYYPFFVQFRRALLSGDSLLYTWSIGMGLDHLGLISYYLASPLNLLSILVPESLALEYFSLLMPVKLGLASLFFALFLKHTQERDDLSISIFGAFYGMCAWALAYQWNVMWLDTFALLPLVVLGTVRLLRERKFALYTITLFLSIFANYYIGFFTCIFVLLVCICYELCRFPGFKRLLADICVMAFFSVLAIGMTAILELPALAALQTTQSSVNTFPQGFALNMTTDDTWRGLFDVMRQVAGNMGGGLEPSFKEGLPNLYCGVGSIVLAVLFLTSNRVKLMDKLCSVALLVFFVLSFIFRQLDYIWHGFHFTNMIPYRFSFLFSFVLLCMAYRAFLLRNVFKPWQTILAGALASLAFIFSETKTDIVYMAFNLVFLALYLCVFALGQLRKKLPAEHTEQDLREKVQHDRHNRRLATSLLAGVFALELVLNMVNFSVNFPCVSVSNYPKGTQQTESILQIMDDLENHDLFYRAEVTHSQTLNDGALNGYNGISTFTSSANVKVTKFLQALGYGAKNTYNRYCFEESSPVANLFLGLKYMIERDGAVEENPYFDDVYTIGNVHLLRNNAYLPLGFLAEPALAEMEFPVNGNDFMLQNRLITAATGIARSVWYQMGSGELEVEATDVHLTSKSSSGSVSYDGGDTGGVITYRYTAGRSGLMCIDLNLSKKNSFSVSVKTWEDITAAPDLASAVGKELYRETYSLPQMLSVCYVEPGDVVEVQLTCKANESGSINIQAALVNDDVFREAYDVLNASTWRLTHFSNTLVEGVIDCDRDGLLYTSVPQNGNWYAEVDGEPAEIVLTGDVMVGVMLTQGEHTVTLRYHNAAFALGWKISLGCAAIFVALWILLEKPRSKHGKYEK